MAEDTANLVLEWMRRLDRKVDGMADDLSQVKTRMIALERMMAGQLTLDVTQDSEIDTLKRRVDRIEKRLELNEL